VASAVTTEAEVCNGALLDVGHGQFIDNLNENTMEAKACKVIYARTRDWLLERFPWKFAQRRAVLALSLAETRNAWAYCYALPSDCLAPLSIAYPGLRNPQQGSGIRFDWEAGVNGAIAGPGILTTDQSGAELIYTAQVTTVALFTPGFVEALEWALAAKLCLVLPIKPGVALQVKAEARRSLHEAAAAMANHSFQDLSPESEFVTAR